MTVKPHGPIFSVRCPDREAGRATVTTSRLLSTNPRRELFPRGAQNIKMPDMPAWSDIMSKVARVAFDEYESSMARALDLIGAADRLPAEGPIIIKPNLTNSSPRR